MRFSGLTALVVAAASACSGGSGGGGEKAAILPTPEPGIERADAAAAADAAAGFVVVAYSVERRTTDAATADFQAVVRATLADPRGWPTAGFRMHHHPAAPFTVVLAEGDEVDRLCHPLRTRSTYSCQNGPVVAINADRWRTATPQWTGDLATYKVMLVNHEFGHLLGQYHPEPQCPGPGQPAPVMAQQSTELGECLPNPWPLPHEIEFAARHELPLAPPYQPT